MALYDSDGNEVAAFSQEDMETRESELSKLRNELKVKEEELGKFKDKDLNFANLRAQKEEAEKRADSLKNEIDEKLNLAKKEILEGVMKDHYSETLKNLAGDDEELLKKIEFHYGRLNDTAASKTEIDKKLRDAWSLATASSPEDAFNGATFSSSGVSRINTVGMSKKFSQEEKSFAQRLASAGGMSLTDKDFE